MTPKRQMAVTTLLIFGFSVALIGLLFFFLLFASSTKELKKINDDFYLHPFTVNRAASSLKISLYAMRDEALMLVLMRSRNEAWRNDSDQIDAFEREAYQSLDVVKANFLGDMSRVARIEKEMHEWHDIRADIMEDVRRGNFAAADNKVKAMGTPKFNEIVGQVDYVLDYSLHKASQFVADADYTSDADLYHGRVLALALFLSVLVTSVAVVLRVRCLHYVLMRQATRDALTGIHNRRSFLGLVQEEEYRSTRYEQPFSLAVVDLDHFKKVNDTFGHHAGDVVLQHFCAVCLAGLRQSDVLGRLGGEEFGILMPNTRSVEARMVIERIRLALAESVVHDGAAEIRITGSFGLVTSESLSTEQNIDSLFKTADVALYSAKAHGRNQVVAVAAAA